jgi:hypothetical protein
VNVKREEQKEEQKEQEKPKGVWASEDWPVNIVKIM